MDVHEGMCINSNFGNNLKYDIYSEQNAHYFGIYLLFSCIAVLLANAIFIHEIIQKYKTDLMYFALLMVENNQVLN